MADLIKMDLYRLYKSRTFKVCLLVVAALSLTIAPVTKLIYTLVLKAFANQPEVKDISASLETVELSDLFRSPFPATGLEAVILFISVTAFTFADIANGYIKNIAGQVPRKGNTVISKFIVIAVHNFLFIVVSLIANIIGNAISYRIVADSQVIDGIITCLLKCLLLQSIGAILLFITTGLRNKTFASIAGVLLGSGLLGLVYIGIDTMAAQLFRINDLNSASAMPDQLLAAGRVAARNAIISSAVIIGIFLPLTVHIFNKSDVR